MNGHLKLKPRVPRIQKLPKHGPVGVLKPCCIIIGGFTRRWDISARWPSRKNGSPIKKGSPHNRSAKGDAKRGQVQEQEGFPPGTYIISQGHGTIKRGDPLLATKHPFLV
jgi:hypothetical protein